MTANKWISALAVATAMSMASFTSGAAGVSDDGAPTRTVKVWDLDLSKPTDVQTLYDRMQAAAKEMCRTEANREWMAARRPVPHGWTEGCVMDAVDSAVRGMANQRLVTLHANAAARLL